MSPYDGHLNRMRSQKVWKPRCYSFEEYLENTYPPKRINTVTCSEDRELLGKIFVYEMGKSNLSVSLKQTLVRRVQDPDILKEHIYDDGSEWDSPLQLYSVTKTILVVLQDQEMFKEVFEKKLTEELSLYCLSKIKDEDYLDNILKNTEDSKEIVGVLKNTKDLAPLRWAYLNRKNDPIVQKYIRNSLKHASNARFYCLFL